MDMESELERQHHNLIFGKDYQNDDRLLEAVRKVKNYKRDGEGMTIRIIR